MSWSFSKLQLLLNTIDDFLCGYTAFPHIYCAGSRDNVTAAYAGHVFKHRERLYDMVDYQTYLALVPRKHNGCTQCSSWRNVVKTRGMYHYCWPRCPER